MLLSYDCFFIVNIRNILSISNECFDLMQK
nr:MAG TPA: hypothetical protein [Caudoviricetes sp.]